ncbi:MAG: tetratricopeptide repeat protein [Bacteroidetes bacterium]|nr:tetratricopeptide repeat protein [Bacteroidota bacterium]
MTIKLHKWLIFAVICLFSLHINAQDDNFDADTLLPHETELYKNVKLIDSARYKEAIAGLKKLIKENPDYAPAYNKMALAKIKMGNYKEASRDLSKAAALDSSNYETLRLKGIFYYLNAQYKESKRAIDSAIAKGKRQKIDDAELFYYQALLMFKGKSYKDALTSCEAALDQDYRFIKAIALKGEIRFAMKDYNYAISELNDAIEKSPDDDPDYASLKLLAKSKFEIKNYKGAIVDWNFYLEKFPKEEEALISRASAKININDNSGAIDDLEKAIKINPKNAVSYNYRGIAKAGNGKYKEGLEDLNYSLKLKFDYAGAYVNRAAIKMELKDKRGACQDLEKADRLGDAMAYKLIERYCKH